jgi:hypothetical protein
MLPNWVRTISVAMFVVSFIAGMALVSWHEISEVRNDTLLATLIAIVVKGEAVSVLSAAIAGTFEGGAYIVVIAYEMVKRSFDRGRAEGRAEGLSYARKRYEEYLMRMQEARERGEEFNEPLPTFEDE